MAGRKPNLYSTWEQPKDYRFVTRDKCKEPQREDGANPGHRTAINFKSSTGHTIEFRIFRSTKDRYELFKDINFAWAVCEFCRAGAPMSDYSDWLPFYNY